MIFIGRNNISSPSSILYFLFPPLYGFSLFKLIFHLYIPIFWFLILQNFIIFKILRFITQNLNFVYFQMMVIKSHQHTSTNKAMSCVFTKCTNISRSSYPLKIVCMIFIGKNNFSFPSSIFCFLFLLLYNLSHYAHLPSLFGHFDI